jgi:hypothetical protein
VRATFLHVLQRLAGAGNVPAKAKALEAGGCGLPTYLHVLQRVVCGETAVNDGFALLQDGRAVKAGQLQDLHRL